MTTETFKSDISSDLAKRAFYGVSFFSERRAETSRSDYAAMLEDDYSIMKQHAIKGGTLSSLDSEFDRYRAGFRKRYQAYLHSNSRCVSWFIAGPSNFPAARMNKRSDIASRRLNDFFEFRARAKAAIVRTLRPDLAPIYSSDSDALEKLQVKISQAEALQARMKATNATIRRHAKEGKESQVRALLEMGYTIGQSQRLLEPDFCGRIGFADFELTNNNANIRRMKARCEKITELKNTPDSAQEGENARIEDCPSENRVRLFFPGKPAEDVREKLKRNGFRWTPSLGCWQAYRNWSATELAKQIAGISAVSMVDDSLVEKLAGTAPDFQAAIGRIAGLCQKTVLDVFKLWREYAQKCQDSDQSTLLWEFVQWYKEQLGGNEQELMEAARIL